MTHSQYDLLTGAEREVYEALDKLPPMNDPLRHRITYALLGTAKKFRDLLADIIDLMSVDEKKVAQVIGEENIRLVLMAADCENHCDDGSCWHYSAG